MRILIFWILLSNSIFLTKTYASDIRFKTFNIKDGLSNESSYKLIQDDEGYLWIATNDGLDRFDGIKFTVFKHDNKDSLSVSGNVIMDIMLDKNRALWIATNQGVCFYNKYLDRFDKPLKELKSSYVKSMLQDKDGNYWFASGKQVFVYDSTLKPTQIINQNMDEGWIGNTTILCINQDPEGIIWITTQERGIFSYNPETKEKKSYGEIIKTKEFITAVPDNMGNVWFGSSEIPYVYIIKEKKFYSLNSSDCPYHVPATKLSSVTQDKEGYLWLCNWGDGLTRYDIKNNTYITFKHDENDKSSINNGSIEYAYVDRVGNIWTVGVASGLNVIYKNNIAFNNDGRIPDIKTIEIRNTPAWYNTKIAWLLYFILIAYLIYLYFKKREVQNQRDKELLQKKIDEGRAELDQKIKEVEKYQFEIRERDELEKEMRFHTEGISMFSEIISKNRQNISNLSGKIISELVPYMGANTGIIFIVDDSGPENIMLRSSGEFCFDSDASKRYEFAVGEGYIGTCFVEKKSIIIDNLPDGYTVLRSGFGETSLHHCIFIPILNDTICLGVIEIASLNKFEKFIISFAEKLADNIAPILAISKANEKSQEMHEQNRIQSEELQVQKGQLLQNLEKMNAAQEDLRRQMEVTSKTQEALEKEKTFVDTLLKNAQEFIYFKDKRSCFIKTSDSMAKLFKVTSVEELYGKSDFDFFTEEHARPAYEDEMNIIKTGVPIINKVEKETHPDGRVTYVTTTKMPLYDNNKQIIGTFGISKDITELIEMEQEIKQRNEELQAQEEELRQNLEEMQTVQESLQMQIEENNIIQKELKKEKYLMDALMGNIPEYIYFKDLNSRFIKNSHSMFTLFNVKNQSELLGKSDFDFFDDEHAKPAFEDEQRIIKTGKPIIGLTEKEVKIDGSVSYASTTKLPLRDDNNQIVGTFGISRDITKSMRMEQEIQQRNEELQAQEEELRQNLEEMQTVQENLEIQIKNNSRAQEMLEFEKIMFNTLLDNLTASIAFKNNRAEYIHINKMFADALGLREKSEVNGKTDLDVFVDTYTKESLEKEVKLIRKGLSVLHKEETIKNKNGTDIWRDINYIPIKNNDGEIMGRIVLTWDITDKKNMQDKLEVSLSMLNILSEIKPIILFKLNKDGEVIDVRGSAVSLLGIEKNKHLKQKFYGLFPMKNLISKITDKEIKEYKGSLKIEKNTMNYLINLTRNSLKTEYQGIIIFEND